MKETATKPKELSHFEEEEESTTKDVAHIFKHLKLACEEGKRRVHYFRFLVDPDSFAHTVENMFHFSFLIKVRLSGGQLLFWQISGNLCTTPQSVLPPLEKSKPESSKT